MTKNKLFTDFDPVSAKAFKQKIQFDLKGGSYNDTLVWNSNEGIDIKPFYHKDDAANFPEVPGVPSSWYIGEDIFIQDPSVAATMANTAIEAGVETLYFIADTPFDCDTLFNTISSQEIPIHFRLQFLNESFCNQLIQKSKDHSVYLNIDLIHHLAEDGNWYHNLKEDHRILDALLQKESHTLSIDLDLYQNAGANMVQQLAYGLAHANEYLQHLETQQTTTPSLTFQVAIGSNYFFEIAKLRALRQLMAILIQEYVFAKALKIHIIARPSLRNKTIYDYNTNMLRTTTEVMSAVLGGADTIINMPYDYIYHKTNDFGRN